jgi:ABC-type Fe3+-siderophore transport system permease subunit
MSEVARVDPSLRARHWRRRAAATFAGTRSGAVLLGAIVLGASIGPAGPEWWRVPLALLDHLPLISVDSGVTTAEWNIVWRIRMPRVILAALVGGMLSVAGAGYQGVFRNPLVDPYLLGAAAGAGLGATIALTAGRGVTACVAGRSGPGAQRSSRPSITVAVTYLVGASFHGSGPSARSGVTLVLAGVAVVSFVTAVQTFILQRNQDVVREVFQWILGRLSGATWSDVRLILPYVAISGIVLMLHRRHLDVFRVGDEEAAALGVSVRANTTGDRDRRHARHGGGRVGERSDRIRRSGRAARHPVDGRCGVSAAHPAVDVARRVVPDPRRHSPAGCCRARPRHRSAW